MADRKFEFSNVASNYENMKKILGDPSVSDSIAGILHNIDEDMKNHVDVVDMAIYGDLGKQMLLNWENTSSTFGSFINNFDNWNKAVAMASGNYTEFVNKVQGLRDTNPLGMTSGGITEAYTNTGYYSSFNEALIDTAAAKIGPFVAYNGLGYFDTGSVALEEQRKTAAMWSFGLNLVADVLSVVGIGKYVKAAGGVAGIGSKISGVFAQTGDDALNLGAKALTSGSGAAANLGKTVANIGDDGLINVGKYAGQSFDDLLKGKTTQEMRVITQELVDDGVIQNADDLARLFGGNASVAKTHLTSRVYNSYVKGFKQAATGATVTAPVANAPTTAGSTGSSSNLLTAAKDGFANMSDEAIAKAIGIPKQQLLDEAAMAGMSTKQFAMEYAKANSGVLSSLSELGAKGSQTFANMSDEAIAKAMGIPKQQLLDEAAMAGMSTKQFAMEYAKANSNVLNTLSGFGTKMKGAGTWINSHLPKLPEGYVSQVTSQASHLLSTPGTKTVISSYVPRFIANNMLSDDAMATTTYTDSVYVSGTGTE